jgi:uncharacterized protein YkwD
MRPSRLDVTLSNLLLFAASCSASPLAPHGSQPATAAVAATSSAEVAAPAAPGEPPAPGDEVFVWQSSTFSPRPGGAAEPGDRDLLARCEAGDEALAQAAARLAKRQAQKLAALDMSEVSFALRTRGSPYVWPRAWTIEGTTLDRADVGERMKRWLGTFDDGGERRCGVATLEEADGKQIIAAIAVDALADLAPIPTQVRAGQWVDVQAKLLVPAREAKVVVLGPTGGPRTVTSSLSSGIVKARFSADHSGPWIVQVLASVAVGPRPVAEATVHAGEAPPATFHAREAPGEGAAERAPDPATAMERMVNAARASERLPVLRRDERLDRIAQAQAEAMRASRRIGHDIGLGDPRSRVEAAGLAVRAAGENVSHAATLRRAHRSLWASPSHRGNLLHPRFNAVGVGVAPDPDGSVWVCEVFADFR